jgi:PAS domain S-box-containing protein
MAVFYAAGETLEWLNEAAAALLGEPVESLQGRPIFEFVEPIDRPKVEERYWAKQGGQIAPRTYEAKIRRRDGVPMTVEVLSIAVGPRQQIAIVQDLTSRM